MERIKQVLSVTLLLATGLLCLINTATLATAGQKQQPHYKEYHREITATVGEEFGIELESTGPAVWFLLTIARPDLEIPLVRIEGVHQREATEPVPGAPTVARWIFCAKEEHLTPYLYPIVFIQKSVHGGPIYEMLHVDITVKPAAPLPEETITLENIGNGIRSYQPQPVH